MNKAFALMYKKGISILTMNKNSVIKMKENYLNWQHSNENSDRIVHTIPFAMLEIS